MEQRFPAWLINMSRCLLTALACYAVSLQKFPKDDEQASCFFVRLIHDLGFDWEDRCEATLFLYGQNRAFGVDYRVIEWTLDQKETFLKKTQKQDKKKGNKEDRG